MKTVDPYYEWLGIPPKDQPPNHYRLLGLELFEENRSVIDAAANRQMSFIKEYQAGADSELSQKLLNELSAARLCLLSAPAKAAYDEQLRAQLRTQTASAPAMPVPPALRWRNESDFPAPPQTPPMGVVQLVHQQAQLLLRRVEPLVLRPQVRPRRRVSRLEEHRAIGSNRGPDLIGWLLAQP